MRRLAEREPALKCRVRLETIAEPYGGEFAVVRNAGPNCKALSRLHFPPKILGVEQCRTCAFSMLNTISNTAEMVILARLFGLSRPGRPDLSYATAGSGR